MFKYLAYVSRQSHVITDKGLKVLLSESRINNSATAVTGILIYFRGNFIQYIEGEEETIDQLYKKIVEDKRHQDVTELDSGFNKARALYDWSMAFKKLQKDEASVILGYKDLERKKLFNDARKLEDYPALRLLNNYIKSL